MKFFTLPARSLLWGGAAAFLLACLQALPPSPPAAGSEETNLGQIILTIGLEPRTLIPSIGSDGGGPAEHLFEVVHQSLVTYDPRGHPLPRVAEALPSLENGSWRVAPDGTMETVWRLREGVRWHDGRPITAADVVFSWRVFNHTAVPVASRRVARLIESAEALDQHTVLFRWRSRYPFANQLSGFDLTLLPSHLLEASFDLRPQQLAGHPYWQASFVGLGPYRVARWIAGSSLELQPFEGYFLGRPSARHISVRFLPDDNAAMAAVLGGSVDLMLPRKAALGIVRGVRQQWATGTEGTLSIIPAYSWVFLSPQFLSPEPLELRDIRFRQALAYALDRRAIAETIAGDPDLAEEFWIPNADARKEAVTNGVPRTAYMPDRSLDLLRELGWRKEGTDDVLVRQGQRLELELTTTSEWYLPAALVAEYWRQVGLGMRESVVSLANIWDRQSRSTYPGVELAGGAPSLALLDSRLRAANAPSAENLWIGANRGHYASRQMDALFDRLWQSLAPREVDAAERDIARWVAEELPVIGLFFHPAMTMARPAIRKVKAPEAVTPAGRLFFSWNAHEWEKRPG